MERSSGGQFRAPA